MVALGDRRDALLRGLEHVLDLALDARPVALDELLGVAAAAPELALEAGAVAVSDPKGEVQTAKGEILPDPDLRDNENVPLDEDIEVYFQREVIPHVPDAWIDHAKTKVGYEIPFTRHFYVYTPPRPLAEIDAELRDLEAQIQKLLGEVTG